MVVLYSERRNGRVAPSISHHVVVKSQPAFWLPFAVVAELKLACFIMSAVLRPTRMEVGVVAWSEPMPVDWPEDVVSQKLFETTPL